MKFKLIAALALLLAGSTCGNAQILNGDFETPAIGDTSIAGIGLIPGLVIYTSLVDPGGITDWTVASGDVTLVDAAGALTTNLGLFTANTGNQYVVLNGLQENVTLVPLGVALGQTGSGGTLDQTFATTAGKSYQLSFAYRGLAVGALGGNPILDVNVSNAMTMSTISNSLLTASVSANAWNTDTFTFVATGTSSELSFYQTNSGPTVGLVGLDSVVLTALPEPSQYMAAACGFLALLIMGRVLRPGLRTADGNAVSSAA